MAGSIENRDEIRDFLASRRERLSPEQVGVRLSALDVA
jgi:hypothetical protein